MTHATLLDLAGECISRASESERQIATAESCTGGMIAAALTDIAGSSAAFDRGFVTYSNAAKCDLLGVEPVTIDTFGAVSAETARSMAFGALQKSDADLAIAVTGVAGPGGGTAEKPVGLVYMGLAAIGRETVVTEFRFGDIGRSEVRRETVREALKALIAALS